MDELQKMLTDIVEAQNLYAITFMKVLSDNNISSIDQITKALEVQNVNSNVLIEQVIDAMRRHVM